MANANTTNQMNNTDLHFPMEHSIFQDICTVCGSITAVMVRDIVEGRDIDCKNLIRFPLQFEYLATIINTIKEYNPENGLWYRKLENALGNNPIYKSYDITGTEWFFRLPVKDRVHLLALALPVFGITLLPRVIYTVLEYNELHLEVSEILDALMEVREFYKSTRIAWRAEWNDFVVRSGLPEDFLTSFQFQPSTSVE